MFLQIHTIRPECGGIHHLRAKGRVAALHLCDSLRMLQHPRLGALPRAKASLLQLGAGGSIQQQGKFQFHM